MPSIVFVHGTGVRLKEYSSSFNSAEKIAKLAGLQEEFVECDWGDPCGVEYSGKSLPDLDEVHTNKEQAAAAQWD